MFLKDYLTDLEYQELLDTYDYRYLEGLDKKLFLKNYQILVKYNIDFINDIILRYLEIFLEDSITLEKNILKLIKELGVNYKDIISHDLRSIDKLITMG